VLVAEVVVQMVVALAVAVLAVAVAVQADLLVAKVPQIQAVAVVEVLLKEITVALDMVALVL
jgi:hypothetical protein